MNVYDFDKTIYAKDSSIEFLFFALKHNPAAVSLPFGKFIIIFILYKLKLVSKIKAKEAMFGFLPNIPNVSQLVTNFWQGKTLEDWYIKQHQKDDVIISASPRFLITPILQENHIKNIIASEVDHKTGKFFSKNCYGEEKVVRFRQEYPSIKVQAAYSDSLSDMPMFEMAKNKYLIYRKKHTVKLIKL